MSGQGESTATEVTPEPSAQGESTSTTTANPFLAVGEANKPPEISDHVRRLLDGVPEEYLSHLAPKVKEWDQGVTQRFEEKNAQLKAYEGIDPEKAKEAISLYDQIFQNPDQALALIQQMKNGQPAEEPLSVEPDEDEDIYNLLPPSIKEKLDLVPDLQKAVQLLINEKVAVANAENQTQELSEYNSLLDSLEADHGSFNRDIVTHSIANGIDPVEAVTMFQEAVKTAVAEQLKAHNGAPTILAGKSLIPIEAPNIAQLNSKDTRNLVKRMLDAQNAE